MSFNKRAATRTQSIIYKPIPTVLRDLRDKWHSSDTSSQRASEVNIKYSLYLYRYRRNALWYGSRQSIHDKK